MLPCTYLHNGSGREDDLLPVSPAGLRKTRLRHHRRKRKLEAQTAAMLSRTVKFSFTTVVTTFWPGFRPLSTKIRSEGD